MTATTSHTEIETESNMHRMINWIMVFSLSYGCMVYWWTNSFHFGLLLQVLSPETQQYMDNRTQTLQAVHGNYWWQPILDIIGPIVTTAGVTFVAIFMKGLAEMKLKNLKSRKQKKHE